jgi:rsbT co-antagonist protein RsbR
MLWHNLRLRHRILLGYGLMLLLIVALALFLMLRADSLNRQIRSLSAEVATETTAGTRLAAAVATTQQAVDRYFQQPTPDNLGTATEALEHLTAEIGYVRATLVSPQQRSRLDNLAGKLALYRSSFQTLSALLEAQRITRGRMNDSFFDATNNLNKALTAYLHVENADLSAITRFVRAQQHLQLAILWSVRLIGEQTDDLGQHAIEELTQANSTLTFQRDRTDGETREAIELVLKNAELSRIAIAEYTSYLAQIRQQRNTLLNEQGGQLQSEADAIASVALNRLTTTTSDLERQSQLTQQLTVVALVLTLIVAAAFGWLLPRTMTRPLMELVAATKRLMQGDYDVVVATRDRSEIGELAAAFNQTTAALSQQRAEVVRQQVALAEQNHELEQTLAELHASTTVREQLADTVKTLSVPVVPILDGVLLLPLVGEIDSQRAQLLLERLLEGITTHRARMAILDITGVPIVDLSLVDWLLKATWAAQLMGARCVLVGIGPEVAQAIVANGADLTSLTTRADLRSAVEHAARDRGLIATQNSH